MWYSNKKGFTLVELLAVIVIMGILMAIAIPSVSSIINKSKAKVYVQDALSFVSTANAMVTNETLKIDDYDTTYYIHINNLLNDNSDITKSPFSDWLDAYVVITLNKDGTNDYYWVSCDQTGWKINLKSSKTITAQDVHLGRKYVNNRQPIKGKNIISVMNKDGVTEILPARHSLTEEEAKKCFSFKNLSDSEAELTYYKKKCGTDVTIPGMIGDREVTSIHNYTFRNMGITSVYIPDTIKKIGNESFKNNNIKSLHIPSSVIEIKIWAFANNKIKDLTYDEGIKTIGASAFQYNQLTEAIIPDSVTSLGACAYCNNPIPNPSFLYVKKGDSYDYTRIRGYIGDLSEFPDKVFRIPGEINGVKLKVIESGAFQRMSLSDWEVVIPDTVIDIQSSAFAFDGISKVNIPNGVISIGGSAFYSNKIKELKIPQSVVILGGQAFNTNAVQDDSQAWIYKRTTSGIDYSTLVGYAGAKKKDVTIPAEKNGVKLKTIASGALGVSYFTGTLKIPSTVTSIGTNAFMLNYVTYVDNGDGNLVPGFVYARDNNGKIDYTNIIGYAAYGTDNVIIPEKVKTISNSAFYYSNIKAVTLPEGLIKIGNNAFRNCKLGSLTIPSTVTSIGTDAFRKEITYDNYNSSLTKIVNKTGRKFDWKSITGGPSEANFDYGTVENWYGDIEVVKE